jgi:hypothetical protein
MPKLIDEIIARPWSPSDNSVGKHRNCLLGRKEIYERRMVNTNCYNGRDREKLVTVENCVCDRSDYQCDFGFVRDQVTFSFLTRFLKPRFRTKIFRSNFLSHYNRGIRVRLKISSKYYIM